MNSKFKIIIMALFAVGMIIWFANLTIKPGLTDYMLGFLSGISTVFMLVGIAYMAWSLGKKKNPFNFKQ